MRQEFSLASPVCAVKGRNRFNTRLAFEQTQVPSGRALHVIESKTRLDRRNWLLPKDLKWWYRFGVVSEVGEA